MSRLLKSLEPLSQCAPAACAASAAGHSRTRRARDARLTRAARNRYKDRKFEGSLEEYVLCLRRSTTVYVGNLAFHTTEEQIHELFGKCGPLRRIVMGLDKNQMTPCGFCFVEYSSRRDTEDCVKYLNGARLDERDVRIDFDWCAGVPCPHGAGSPALACFRRRAAPPRLCVRCVSCHARPRSRAPASRLLTH